MYHMASSKKEIDNDILSLNAIHTVLEAYEEIASIRMRRTKAYVLRNREFLEGLNMVFARVKNSYKKEIQVLMSKEESSKIKKEIAVLLSANTGLFGSILEDAFNVFYKYVSSSQCDIMIIGKMGQVMYESMPNKKKFIYFDMEENTKDSYNVKPIVETLVMYENVNVFHGEFQDILHQIPTMTALTGEGKDIQYLGQDDDVRSIFEPELKKVLDFFKSQILSALFEQTMYESTLSKYTSRMISLDKASSDVSRMLEKSKLA
ncbi:MAG: F0F1 ATP synthase subunit gamma, partial [Patescibacteria group bacterium]